LFGEAETNQTWSWFIHVSCTSVCYNVSDCRTTLIRRLYKMFPLFQLPFSQKRNMYAHGSTCLKNTVYTDCVHFNTYIKIMQ